MRAAVRLWWHECHRVFADRLISYEDKAWCERCVLEEARKAREASAEAPREARVVAAGLGCGTNHGRGRPGVRATQDL